MQYNNEFFIVKWDMESTNPYLYGTDLKIMHHNSVQFRNVYIPSGTVIQSWVSNMAFHSYRRSNNLPRLERQKHYKISYKIKTFPEMSTYLKIDFVDIMNEIVSTYIIKQGEEKEVIIPESLLAYNIYLISAGCSSLHFENIIIKSAELPPFSVDNYWIDLKVIHPQQAVKVIFIEPLYQRIGFLTDFDRVENDNVILVNSGYEDAKLYHNDQLVTKLQKILEPFDASAIEYIGYGPISNFAALMYANSNLHSQAKVTDDFYTIEQYRDLIDYYEFYDISVKTIVNERYNSEKVTLYPSQYKKYAQVNITRFHNPSYHVKNMV